MGDTIADNSSGDISPFSSCSVFFSHEFVDFKGYLHYYILQHLQDIDRIFLSCVFGIFLGIISGIHKTVYNLLNPLIVIIRTIPVMSIIIIAIMWFKDTNVPIFVAFLMCFPIIWTNTVSGILSTDVKLLQMCEVYKIKKSRIISSVYFYSSLPYIKAGMISALGIGWKVTSAAEVLSLPKYSIGRFLYDSKVYLEIPDLFAWTIIIVSLSFLFESLLKTIFKFGDKYD